MEIVLYIIIYFIVGIIGTAILYKPWCIDDSALVVVFWPVFLLMVLLEILVDITRNIIERIYNYIFREKIRLEKEKQEREDIERKKRMIELNEMRWRV